LLVGGIYRLISRLDLSTLDDLDHELALKPMQDHYPIVNPTGLHEISKQLRVTDCLSVNRLLTQD